MPRCWIGVGSNVGNARSLFDDACTRLSDHPAIQLQTRSSLYSTRAVGAATEGCTFTNAVFSFDSHLTSLSLLDLLQSIETNLGRVRAERWGSRTIDLDLLFVDQLQQDDARLSLPHPAAWYRRFVIDPLVEISPDLIHPQFQLTIAEMRNRLLERPINVGISAIHKETLQQWQATLIESFPMVRIIDLSDADAGATVCLRLEPQQPAGPWWNQIPVADLTRTPGQIYQRVFDFCTAVFDEPVPVR